MFAVVVAATVVVAVVIVVVVVVVILICDRLSQSGTRDLAQNTTIGFFWLATLRD